LSQKHTREHCNTFVVKKGKRRKEKAISEAPSENGVAKLLFFLMSSLQLQNNIHENGFVTAKIE